MLVTVYDCETAIGYIPKENGGFVEAFYGPDDELPDGNKVSDTEPGEYDFGDSVDA